MLKEEKARSESKMDLRGCKIIDWERYQRWKASEGGWILFVTILVVIVLVMTA